MTKHLFKLYLIIAILIFSNTVAAADPLYRMLHAHEVVSFQEDQDALIIGQIKDKQNNHFLISVIKTVTGRVDSNTIFIDAASEYNSANVNSKINDYMVMSIKRIKDDNYKIAWGAFKASLDNNSNITLIKESSDSSNADLAAIEWFINTNGDESDFFFDGDRAYVNRPNGDTIQIYPNLTQQNDSSIVPYGNKQQKSLIIFGSSGIPVVSHKI